MPPPAFSAPGAHVDAHSQMGAGASVWPHTRITASTIGEKSNVQDNAIVSNSQIGPGVTIGHNAVIENCIVHGPGLVAMNARVKNCVLEPWSAVGANAVAENETIASYHLWVGKQRTEKNPRSLLKPDEIALIQVGARRAVPLPIHRRLMIKPVGRALFNYPEYVKLSHDYQAIINTLHTGHDVFEVLGYRLKKAGANTVRELMQAFKVPYSENLEQLIAWAERGIRILPYFRRFAFAWKNPTSPMAMDLVWPRIDGSAQLAPGTAIFGNVGIGSGTIIEAGVSIRGDYDQVTIGRNVRLAANVSVHTNFQRPCVIEDDATVGAGTVVHACSVRANAAVGALVTLLDGCEICTNVPDQTVVGYDRII